jgi:peptide/nickel transport system substrate-binding protein
MTHRVRLVTLAAAVTAAMALAACGASGPPKGTEGPSGGGGGGTSSGGSTATYAEEPAAIPNYIFPMLTPAYYSTTNIEQFQRLMFRSLFWIGNPKGQPVVDPARSLAAMPTYSNGNTTVTITMGNYKWSDGKPVTTRDVSFWLNLLNANKKQFAAYTPGEFPDNLKSFKVESPKKIVLTLTGPVNPTWFTYDQLSQITPLPQHVMDKTSASGKVGDYDNKPSGAMAVFRYLTGQAKNISSYGSNPVWMTVDGPWKLVGYQSDGYAKFRRNPNYSGPAKGNLKFFIERPFTTDTAELNVLRTGNGIDYGYVPEQESSQISVLNQQGFSTAVWNDWGTTYFPLNFNNPKTGPIVRQPYIRQAMQSLINQPEFVKGPLKGYGHTNYGPVPSQPSNPYSDTFETKAPFPYSPPAATKLLTSHGWKVKPNGVTTCTSAGSGANQCGAGISAGTGLSFTMDYVTGNVEVSQEMQALKSAFSQAGIQLNLSTAPFDTIISRSAPCKPTQSSCSWQMSNWGGGWTYGVDPYPTGDQLFDTNSNSNFGSYDSPTADKLIQTTVHGTGNLDAYEDYLAKDLPVLWMPQPAFQISEINSHLQGTQPQSPILSLTPEDWSFNK